MKNLFKRIGTIVLASVMLLSMTSCGEDKEQTYDPETRPLTFSISALDGTFSPFFATSATDATIAGITQIGMLSTDNEGNVACGEDYPTVVLDYKITTETVNGKTETTYDFVIKNGIKFSDGVDLTIKDVLFNLYVYLDPMYSGSSTVYSVDIQGLKAYRNNDPTMADTGTDNDQKFRANAQQRINNIIAWSQDKDGEVDLTSQMQADLAKIRTRFKSDLESDWNGNAGGLESYVENYSFTEDWQSFLYIEGIIGEQYEKNSSGNYEAKKDANGKYITQLNEDNCEYPQMMKEAASAEKIKEYQASHNNCSEEIAKEALQKAAAIQIVYDNYADDNSIKSGVYTILYGMSTGSNIFDEWVLEEQSNFFNSQSDSVKEISGISTYKTGSFNGVNKVKLKEEHDVLSIKINGIDPKAIWNFAFAVAPMHYYSDAETIANTTEYPYGVKARDNDFFKNVLGDDKKNALPVGAGAYRASTAKGTKSNNPSDVNSADFWTSKKVYFERNEYFETTGSGQCNAKIKYFIYEEVGDSNILNRLIEGSIDYGTPNAKPANVTEVNKYDHLASIEYKSNGYGYVGINPKYVPDLEIRQAIMTAFDTSTIIGEYYGGNMAEKIIRPMTKLSWAYPDEKTTEEYYKYNANTVKEDIKKLVTAAGYTEGSDGIYQKNGHKLEYKFTIAGDTEDHPAAKMFEKARQILNQCGFKITVGTDVSALKKLSKGELAVWAAAWSSTVDPDMYQIYHKDSKTTNRKNWNYDEILNTSKYPEEKKIVLALSELIDQGRETNSQSERTAIYAQALDQIMELAVEYPTYQRKDLAVYNKKVIDSNTLHKEKEYKYSGPTERMWEINYN